LRFWRLCALGACLALSGCVIGYGHCLFMEPVKNTLTGRVHFRAYPAADGVDNVPILSLDQTAYVYSPAQSHQCLSANDVQLVGVAEFPQDIIENSHVTVYGSLFGAASSRQHTRFVVNVLSILPMTVPH
jgi:hypothetical protein